MGLPDYEGKLPAEVIDIWRKCGFGTFYNGYLKVINPDDYKELLERSYFRGDVSIPIFATAFGDLITWEENQYTGIAQYRYGENHIIADGFKFFIGDVMDGSFDEEYFSIRQYNAVVKKAW